jgi:hypothetical protein
MSIKTTLAKAAQAVLPVAAKSYLSEQKAELTAKLAETAGAIQDAKRKLADLQLSNLQAREDVSKGVEPLEANLARLEQEDRRLRGAMALVNDLLIREAQEAGRAKRAEAVQKVRDAHSKLGKSAAKLSSLIKSASEEYRTFVTLNGEMVTSVRAILGSSIGPDLSAFLTTLSDTRTPVAREIYRHGADVHFPGGAVPDFRQRAEPGLIEPLAGAIQRDGAYLVALLEGASAPAVAPVAVPAMSAAEVQAGIQKVRLA